MSSSSNSYSCSYTNCTRTYKCQFSLKRHMKEHQGVKDHKCKYCPKAFTLAQYLREHIYIHTNERPFVCHYPGCSKSFRQSGKFSLHKKIHEDELKTTWKASANEDIKYLIESIMELHKNIKETPVPYYLQSRTLPLPFQLKEHTTIPKPPSNSF